MNTLLRKIILNTLCAVLVFSVSVFGVFATTLGERLGGRILLQVESKGEAWYVNPIDGKRYYLGRPDDAFAIMRKLGLGITNKDISKIPVEGENNPVNVDIYLINRLKGRILLQVESKGEAWYVNPIDGKRYYLGRPDDAFSIMRDLGLGITNFDIGQIEVAEESAKQFSAITEDVIDVVSVDNPDIELSGPLTLTDVTSVGAPLTYSGLFEETNKRRLENGLNAFRESEKLKLMAEKKVNDMIDKGYFEHVSPDGKGIEDLAEEVGYEYITIGENLALGNIFTDSTLLDGWMNSPGHRANILNKTFTELGIAASRGVYKGNEVWFAVQEFGKPLSDCPTVDNDLYEKITSNKPLLDSLYKTIIQQRKRLDDYIPINTSDENEVRAYNLEVESYNVLVNDFNSQQEELSKLITEYNAQVNKYTECAEG